MCAYTAEGFEAAAASGEEASRQTAGETPGDPDQQQDQDRYTLHEYVMSHQHDSSLFNISELRDESGN